MRHWFAGMEPIVNVAGASLTVVGRSSRTSCAEANPQRMSFHWAIRAAVEGAAAGAAAVEAAAAGPAARGPPTAPAASTPIASTAVGKGRRTIGGS
ncbi:hypothetical protein GCM10025883_02390 [Mobilicoccus caccae]|uniref:Uncharacterized protein n=1 Tax=Mobilicoccus caccae TaxID=1859295 RepID=A0ABQ6IKH4_9MICO|nr:hypothetical protein GCM10025883_02390 [Mobilicoccus caccae]